MNLEQLYDKILEKSKELKDLGIDPVSLIQLLGCRQQEEVARKRRDLSGVRSSILDILKFSTPLTILELQNLLETHFDDTSRRKAYLTIAALLSRMELAGEVKREPGANPIRYTVAREGGDDE